MVPGTDEGFRIWEGDIARSRRPLRVDPEAVRKTLALVDEIAARMPPVPAGRGVEADGAVPGPR